MAGDTVQMMIPMEEIQNLPEGAVFTQKVGRTRLKVERRGKSLYASAETDSLGQTVSRYERKARDSLLCNKTASTEETLIKGKNKGTWHRGVLLGVALIVGTIIGIRKLFK